MFLLSGLRHFFDLNWQNDTFQAAVVTEITKQLKIVVNIVLKYSDRAIFADINSNYVSILRPTLFFKSA